MLSVLAQRAASEGPRWTRAIENIPVAPIYNQSKTVIKTLHLQHTI